MTTAVAQPAWTFSSLELFEQCPRRYYHQRVAKDVVDPPNEYSIWGKRVHDAMEYRIKDGTPLPEGMTQWEGIAAKLAALPGEKFTEVKMSVDGEFSPAPWGASWSRGIVDLLVVHGDKAVVLDYKTGKRKMTEQLELYAAYTFAHFPQVSVCTNAFVWLKEKKLDKSVAQRCDTSATVTHFKNKAQRIADAHDAGVWPARPSGLCRAWCPVTSCAHNGKKNQC